MTDRRNATNDFGFKEVGEQLYGPGKLFDQRAFMGNIRGILLSCIFIAIGWHIYDLLAWWDSLWGVEAEIDPAKQSWARLWAVILGSIGIASSIAAMIMIPIQRRRAAKSAKGQWYDDPALTREALHGTPDEPVDRETGATGDTDHARREEKSS